MSEVILLTLKFLSIGCVVLIIGSLVSALAYPLFRGAIQDCHPAARSILVVCYGLIALVVAVTVVVLIMHPELSRLLIPAHCHDAVCGSHVPVVHTSSIGSLSLITGGSLLLVSLLIGGLHSIRTARRRLRTLFGIAQRDEQRGYLTVESPDLFALCCGIWNTKILVSQGLAQRLTPQQLRLVLAHEEAHGYRMDNLRILALRYLTAFWPRAVQSRACLELASDIEKACDFHAVESLENRDDYVAILKIMMPGHGSASGTSKGTAFDSKEAAERIAQLLDTPERYRSIFTGIATLFLFWIVQIAATTGLIHYLVEWISSLGM